MSHRERHNTTATRVISIERRVPTPRLRRIALALLCVLIGTLFLSTGVARAAFTHEFLPEPSEKVSEGVPVGSGAPLTGLLSVPFSMTVDSSELYLADGSDSGAARIDTFDASSGVFVRQFPQVPSLSFLHQGVVVGHSTGEVEVYVGGDELPKGAVAVFDAAGSLQAVWKGSDTPSKAFGCFECAGSGDVAVDNSAGLTWAAGDVYVADPLNQVVDVFEPSAGGGEKYVTRLEGPEPPGVLFGRPVSVAVSQSSGEVLVVDGEEEVTGKSVDIFRPTAISGQYEFVGKLTGTPQGSFEFVTGVSVDGGNGDIYVVEGEGRARVFQFNAAGEYLTQFTGTPAGPFTETKSVAVDSVTHHVYIGDYSQAKNTGLVDVYGETLIIPDVAVTEPSSNPKPTSVTLRGTVNPDEAGEATCEFEYGTSTSYGQKVSCTGPVANGNLPVGVESELVTELSPDTTYHYRLDATNKNATNTGECPEDCGEFTTPGPGIRGESVSNVASSSATLNATIDPHNAPTSYYFQYSTAGTTGCEATSSSSSCPSVPAPPGAPLGSGEGDLQVSQHVQTVLSSGTTYHYRVIAISELKPGEVGAFAGPDQTFTTQTPGGFVLPDTRAWEMVSPPNKLGAAIFALGLLAPIQASAAGGALTYTTTVPTEAEPQGNAQSNVQVLSTRAPGGWGSRDLALPHSAATGQGVGAGGEYRFSSENLSLGVVQPFGRFDPSLSPEASEQTAFLRTNYLHGNPGEPCLPAIMPCYRPLVTGAPGFANVPEDTVFGEEGRCPPATFCGPEFLGASPDSSHVVVKSTAPLMEGASKGDLYEWSGGRLALVSVLPGNGGSAGVSQLGYRNGDERHAISDDGSHVVWEGPGKHLYLRDLTKEETVQLDAVQPGASGTNEPQPVFQLASSDGSRVFFLDRQRLTEDSGAKETGEAEGDLYECKITEVEGGGLGCGLSNLTPLNSKGESAVVHAVLGASEDGSWVYFAADGVLAPGAVSGNCGGTSRPQGGASCNLYVRHDGVTSLVAVVSSEDFGDWAHSNSGNLDALTARVSSDGRWLAFMSLRSLTGYDNRDAISGNPEQEFYLYDRGSGRLVCASCNPTGARPDGREFSQISDDGRLVGASGGWEPTTWLAGSVPGWTPSSLGRALYQSRYLSDSGRLFFDSSDGLVPQDVNGTEDVYEYEPPGVGGCSTSAASFSERSGGCVGLISSGASPDESAFLDASGSGGDVFFLTTARLNPQDYDTALDVYDAHECTSVSPCLELPPPPRPSCTTEASCKAAPSPQPPIFGAGSSETFSGVGNIAPVSAPGVKPKSKPKKCKRGFVKKRGKCVRKRAKKAGRAKRAVGRGGRP